MKSTWAKPGSFEQKWYLYDAENVILGRLASKIAMTLMGKNKPIYTPSIDTGDFVVVVNADKIATTGKFKSRDKKYYRCLTITTEQVEEKHQFPAFLLNQEKVILKSITKHLKNTLSV